jgi:hypothetical protein
MFSKRRQHILRGALDLQFDRPTPPATLSNCSPPQGDASLLDAEYPPPPRAHLCGRLPLRGCLLGTLDRLGGRLGGFWRLSWRFYLGYPGRKGRYDPPKLSRLLRPALQFSLKEGDSVSHFGCECIALMGWRCVTPGVTPGVHIHVPPTVRLHIGAESASGYALSDGFLAHSQDLRGFPKRHPPRRPRCPIPIPRASRSHIGMVNPWGAPCRLSESILVALRRSNNPGIRDEATQRAPLQKVRRPIEWRRKPACEC